MEVSSLSRDVVKARPSRVGLLRMIQDTLNLATPQVGELLATLQGETDRETLQAALGLSDRKSFRERYLKSALADGLIEMTLPDKLNSRLQKYRLTDRGCRWLAQWGGWVSRGAHFGSGSLALRK